MIVILGASDSELELENLAVSRLLGPAVDQLEQTVVHPNARTYFFVDLDPLWWCFPFLIFPRSFSKKSILGEGAARIALQLIDLFWVGTVHSSGNIVSFVNQHAAFIFYPIGVWSPRTDAHQNSALRLS